MGTVRPETHGRPVLPPKLKPNYTRPVRSNRVPLKVPRLRLPYLMHCRRRVLSRTFYLSGVLDYS